MDPKKVMFNFPKAMKKLTDLSVTQRSHPPTCKSIRQVVAPVPFEVRLRLFPKDDKRQAYTGD